MLALEWMTKPKPIAPLSPSGVRLRRLDGSRYGRLVLSNVSLRSMVQQVHPLKRHDPTPDKRGWGHGGGGGIRTHGTFRLSGFQDRRNRPLYHPS